ncbi:ribonuclease Z [Dactylosporangium sp. NBC_01737]|uniref:ribonuclease Z n=1 Tax=Dactylosporangium sp. NBC_01737 TaxID=2975959 RepID=UPI002E0EE78E|nr:ribonuclease Z [Dactylosporangium sp. NBC_01737]
MRELVVLGTSSQVPTRTRNHNGYFLSWDGEGILFDPGDGTQRQMSLAGVSASDITRICVTHFHGDHCLGLPGVIQRISLDNAPHPVTAHFPASGREFYDRLRNASVFYDAADIRPDPIADDGFIATSPKWSLEARRLDHGIDTYGYRLVEADGRRMVPELLRQHGVSGPAVGSLQRDGVVTVDGRAVTIEAVSVPRPGQRFAFVMDTRLCEGVFALAAGADLLVIESTYLDVDAGLAAAHGHLTAGQAARVAAECGVRTLVLTHFSQRYDDPTRFAEEAAKAFDGEVVVAEDLTRVRVPARRP